MSNSNLISCIIPSPNHSGKRTHKIDRITPHCIVGQLSAESIGGCFLNPNVEASCNYGIGTDGRIVLCVDEDNRSWCSSSNENDQRAVTIECASDMVYPYYINDTVINSLVNLVVDICKRNGINKLLWFADKNYSLAYVPKSNEAVLTVHRWFANKSCPGDYMYNKLNEITERINLELLNTKTIPSSKTIYRVQVGAYTVYENAVKKKKMIDQMGLESFITEENGFYKVQLGAFEIYANAVNFKNNLISLGIDAFIKEVKNA